MCQAVVKLTHALTHWQIKIEKDEIDTLLF